MYLLKWYNNLTESSPKNENYPMIYSPQSILVYMTFFFQKNTIVITNIYIFFFFFFFQMSWLLQAL